MSSEDPRFLIIEDIDDRVVTADDSANTGSSNGGLAIPIAILGVLFEQSVLIFPFVSGV